MEKYFFPSHSFDRFELSSLLQPLFLPTLKHMHKLDLINLDEGICTYGIN